MSRVGGEVGNYTVFRADSHNLAVLFEFKKGKCWNSSQENIFGWVRISCTPAQSVNSARGSTR